MTGAQVLSLACTAPGRDALPLPCGTADGSVWSVALTKPHLRERVMVRLQSAVSALDQPTRRDLVRTATAVMLPVDPPGREEACVNIAFFSAATVNADYADRLRDGYRRILDVSVATFREAGRMGELRAGIDPELEAPTLYFLTQGLIGPVLIGLYTPDEALAVVDRQLDRVFRQRRGPTRA